jgi:2-amino-4-hydroxy-6-hydroxymethyldihydropteridine diphosphokinase
LKQQKVFLLLGGNEGDVQLTFRKAISKIENQLGSVLNQSSLYKTAAWGPIAQNDFINQIFVITTTYPPHFCLQKLLKIEHELGRFRTQKYGPRTIDIDILFYGNEIIRSKDLKVPHPEIQNRNFVLYPLQEIQANFKHPALKKTITELLHLSKDPLKVEKM